MPFPKRAAAAMPDRVVPSFPDTLMLSIMPVRSGSPPFVACSMDDSVTRRINALHPSISALQRALTSLPNASVAVSDHIAIARPTPIRPGLGESGNTGFESFKRKPQPSDRDDMAEQSPGTKYLKVEPMNCSAPLDHRRGLIRNPGPALAPGDSDRPAPGGRSRCHDTRTGSDGGCRIQA
eukprot:761370-Hanusia_phi.AAC.2